MRIDPKTAFERQQAGAVLLDVRTAEEVARGGPAGALHEPVLVLVGDRMDPVVDFADRVAARVARDTDVVVISRIGARARHAALWLERAGFDRVASVEGGYEGQRDAWGDVLVPGWRDHGLPTEP